MLLETSATYKRNIHLWYLKFWNTRYVEYIYKKRRQIIYLFIKELKYFQELNISSISFYYYLPLCKRQKCNNQHYIPLDSLSTYKTIT